MKKIIVFLLMIVLVFNLSAEEKKTSSKIKEVTIYRQNAKIIREASVSIPAGITKIVFENLETVIQQQSIQVRMTEGVKLLSVSYGIDYLKDKQVAVEYKILTDSVDFLNKQISWINEQQKVITGEERVINENIKLGSAQQGVSVAELKALSAYYSQRIMELKKQNYDLSIRENELKTIRTRIQNQMSQMNVNNSTPSGYVAIEITSSVASKASFQLSYVVTQVSWAPVYDVRSDGINKDVQIVYKANVIQNTGVDWNNVKLSINTGNPNLNNNRPILVPRYLYAYTPPVIQEVQVSYDNMRIAAPAAKQKESKMEVDADDYSDDYVQMSVVETATNIEFQVDQPYNIVSDNQAHLVTMSESTVPADYEYHTVPSLDKAAFLLAKITGWGNLNLLAANANIFLNNTYIGQTYINPNITSDTLLISFGRDEKIVVKREKVGTECKTTTVMGTKKHNLTFEITIRNTKSTKIHVNVLDQIPLSNIKDVEVELIDKGNAEYDASLGKLSWDLIINPNETKTFRFSYSVKHPKSLNIQGI